MGWIIYQTDEWQRMVQNTEIFHENLFDVYDMIVESLDWWKKTSVERQDVVFQLSHLDWN
jgi:hypothetical protein